MEVYILTLSELKEIALTIKFKGQIEAKGQYVLLTEGRQVLKLKMMASKVKGIKSGVLVYPISGSKALFERFHRFLLNFSCPTSSPL